MAIWETTKIGDKHKIVLPKKLMKALKASQGDKIMWVECIKNKRNKKNREFTLNIVVIPKE